MNLLLTQLNFILNRDLLGRNSGTVAIWLHLKCFILKLWSVMFKQPHKNVYP